MLNFNMVEKSISDTRSSLTSLPESLDGNKVLKVTRHGKPVLAILPRETWELILDTLEILGNTEEREKFKRYLNEYSEKA